MNEEHPVNAPDDDDLPPLEDAAEPQTVDEVVPEDDPEELLEPTIRLLDETSQGDAQPLEVLSESVQAKSSIAEESESDADWNGDDEDGDNDDNETSKAQSAEYDWANETSAHHLIVALRSIETQIKIMLEQRDPRRKRKLTGTRRWCELEEDIISWRFAGRFDEDVLRRMHELIARRHALFNRLKFISGTRPTWNS